MIDLLEQIKDEIENFGGSVKLPKYKLEKVQDFELSLSSKRDEIYLLIIVGLIIWIVVK